MVDRRERGREVGRKWNRNGERRYGERENRERGIMGIGE